MRLKLWESPDGCYRLTCFDPRRRAYRPPERESHALRNPVSTRPYSHGMFSEDMMWVNPDFEVIVLFANFGFKVPVGCHPSGFQRIVPYLTD
jgi:hypothetical protein